MAKAKGAPRSRAWWDGYEHLTPKEFGARSPESDRYAADYEAGALARDQAHERLNAVCAAARRTDALLKREYATRGPAKAVVFGEERELLPVNGMVQN